ncbi:uncharacterized protein [Aristolochia californica]|uniref:uncharacterized protein n=1 Tax=Aristolochia californica TaxID=171875 RepID=UPI0035D6CB48
MVIQFIPCLGCLPWAWKRCCRVGSDDSKHWPLTTLEEFEPVPRICRLILSVYEGDLSCPRFTPIAGYGINLGWIVKRVYYGQTLGRTPPYFIYTDHTNREIVLAIRGLNLGSASDYAIMLDNRSGMQMFDGGFVHHGFLKSAIWLLNQESETLKTLWSETGCSYKMVFAGHSLGSGVAALLTTVVVNHLNRFGGIPRSLIRCYAVAPARCMSINLAVKYADVINSVVLQDDFLPRTSTPLEDHFKTICCMPFFFFAVWMRDVYFSKRNLHDPRRLCPPGRLYHIVERQFCRCGRFPPEVRTACPVDWRFEQVILSCNASSDHEIIWIAREAQRALDLLVEAEGNLTVPPREQRLERNYALRVAQNDAMKTVSMDGLYVQPMPESTEADGNLISQTGALESPKSGLNSSGQTNWDVLYEEIFERNELGKLTLKETVLC